ncbi:MAG: ABC transporter substrate-binding protein [Acidimicrobiia bacterium]|nr:ABC transporter substrate-binding protein [Acidimicrobiia bacterium]MYC57931.1 ABC transporter substrate-binding protein [Acidimicrobiia bacterium]MYG94925.1 ABC transporter substrate-binding protein [Acidimicrobiia bacterium]MYI31234.1 ABC transporter substrate-binding protein [Acidimicrobiia bacterium]
MPRHMFRPILTLLITLALLAAGCGNDNGVTQSSQPERIVSLSPTATEILFAIGAGDQVVAVDEFSYYPPEAPVTNLSGWDPNVEAVLSYEPDLVVIANDANDLMAGLNAVGIKVLLSSAPADFENGYDSIAKLGMATGRIDEAASLIANLRIEIDEALAAAPDVPVRVYHELDNTYFSVSSNSFIGATYAAMGAINIADEADPDGYGYPQLTEEYIVEANPELIVITDLVGYTAEDVAARPGWGEIDAIRNKNIVVVNSDIASRWGPRLPQFIHAVAEALQTVTAPVS